MNTKTETINNITKNIHKIDDNKLIAINRLTELNNRLNSYGYDLTLSGHNYLGPGTKILQNMISDIKPTNDLDMLAFDHDFEYLTAYSEDDILEADRKMIVRMNKLENVGLIDHVLVRAAFAAKNGLEMNETFLSNLSEREKKLVTELYKIKKHEWFGSKYDVEQGAQNLHTTDYKREIM